MFSCIFRFVYSILYGTLVKLQAINNKGVPVVDYTEPGKSNRKIINGSLEVFEGEVLNLDDVGNWIKGDYTWKNEWYSDSGGKNAISFDDISHLIDGNDNTLTIYGKWVSYLEFTCLFNIKQTLEVLKGNSVTPQKPHPYANVWSFIYRKTSGVGPSTINLWTRYSTGIEDVKYEWDKSYVPYGNATYTWST